MQIGKYNTDNKVFLIAEIGNNHEGSFDLAREMIRLAADAGADAVKFQAIVPDRLVAARESARIQQLDRFRFTPNQFEDLRDEADKNGVLFMTTPFDPSIVDWLDDLVPAYKIASGDNDFYPLIDRVAKTGKPVIVSTGFGRAGSAHELLGFLRNSWKRHGVPEAGIGLLHCVVSYPTPMREAGLIAISKLGLLGVTVGYSDHTIGIRAAEMAVAAGARIIEKHFTIDKNYSEFRDHQLSADPEELAELVESIREVETLLGPPTKLTRECEASSETMVRRSIAASRDIAVDETVSWDDLCWVRPRVGLKPGEEDSICGRKLTKPIAHGEAFMLSHFE